jgi:hypothetical protein
LRAPLPTLQYHEADNVSEESAMCSERECTAGNVVMKRILLLVLGCCSLMAADVVTMKDGRQVSGAVESGNITELHIKVGDQSQTVDIHQVQAIQFGPASPGSSAVPPPAKAADPASAASGPEPAQPNSLILKDGTHVPGRWWSIDATDMHFLVNNQLQHYSRTDVLGVTFGSAALPPPPPARSPPPASPAPPPASATQPAPAPTPARSSASPPAQPPTLTRPSGTARPARGLSQPEEIGAVYFWNGKDLTPLERNQAVERGSRSSQYYEMPGPKSSVRINEASRLIFILRLAKGIDPATYSLFSLATVNGSRRTRSQPGRSGALLTWPVDIAINDDTSLMTYTLTVRDLPAGEYSFSPSSSNDGYCFGVDPSEPGQ